jgi:toxin ParE1/3/4
MSARSRRVELSPAARSDYTAILLYTSEHWDEHQMEVYNDLLERAIRTIGANPNIGRRRDDLRPGMRAYQVRHHVIYYRLEDATIRVDRILHRKMHAEDQFEES